MLQTEILARFKKMQFFDENIFTFFARSDMSSTEFRRVFLFFSVCLRASFVYLRVICKGVFYAAKAFALK